MGSRVSRPRAVKAGDWDFLISRLEEYRDRDCDHDDIGFEANEAAQTITEQCIKLFLSDTETSSSRPPHWTGSEPRCGS